MKEKVADCVVGGQELPNALSQIEGYDKLFESTELRQIFESNCQAILSYRKQVAQLVDLSS